MAFDYDLFVIGAGSGGLAASKRAATYGAKVAIAEQEQVGGTCVIRGCIPKKLLVYAADFAHTYRDAVGYGWAEQAGHFDWRKGIATIQQEVQRLSQLHRDWLEKSGITVLKGKATFHDPHTLIVDGQTFTADKVLIAVGGDAIKPEFPGVEHAITSREMFQLKEQPRHLVIIGAGYIGVEFAGMMQELGSAVTLLLRGEQILTGFDQDVAAAVQLGMSQHGIQFIPNAVVKQIQPDSDGLVIHLEGQEPLTADTVLCATGRAPNVANLRLANAGVELVGNSLPDQTVGQTVGQNERRAIAVDQYSCTTQANIFAVGDCTNRRNLTPVAIAEGRAFADTVFGQKPRAMSYDWIPSAVFSRPEAATIGLTEAQARQQLGEAVQCYRTSFRPLFHSLTGRAEKSFMKLVTHRDTDKIVGAHMVGDSAAEIIQSLAIALKLGATKQDFDSAIGIHPTSAEEWFTIRGG